ncbi:hypothetical protein [Haloferax sp. DFSO60]|uniref:hypothetical protein n=1 Tax=Haloferax sp. DFSO60 TaxID=3388652 RepID=UPI00397A8353
MADSREHLGRCDRVPRDGGHVHLRPRALSTGFTGYFIRKALAGQVMPSSFDRSIAYRGGQGGL